MSSPDLPEAKIKILRVIARLNIGGPAIHVVNLTAGLDRARFEQVLVVGTENPGEGSMLDYALSRGVRPLIIPEIMNEFRLGPRDVKAMLKLYRLIRLERPHIVHTHTARAGFLGRLAARLAGVPVVVHTFHGHVLDGYFGPVKNRLMRSMERALARITDRIVAVSGEVKHALVAHAVAQPAKIVVIPLGFNLEPFLCCQGQRGQFLHELGLNGNARLVGIVGRLFPIKNHRLFLDAAARLARREPSVHFVIIGGGLLLPTLQQYTLELGIAHRVTFTGWRRDLPRIYADLDVLVVSSDNEGTPVSAIEAMASGCPVVATCVGGLPDLISDGETGYLVPPRDPAKLATAVSSLLQKPDMARRMAREGRDMVQRRFAVHRLIADVERLYDDLLMHKAVSTAVGDMPHST